MGTRLFQYVGAVLMPQPGRRDQKVGNKPKLAKKAKKVKSEQQVIWHLQAVARSKKFNQDASDFREKARRRMNSLSPPEGAKYMAKIMTDNPVSRRWQVSPQLVMVDEGTLGDPSGWHQWGWRPWQDFVRDAVSGHFITVTLPLTLPRETVLQLVSDIYDFYSLPQEGKRSKTFTVNPWEVWDRHEERGESLLKIAKDLFKVSGNPNYSDPVKNAQKSISRAYKKAQIYIQTVEENAGR